MTKATTFDFSGTLFRSEDTVSWLRGALEEVGISASDHEIADAAKALEASGGPGRRTHEGCRSARRSPSAADGGR